MVVGVLVYYVTLMYLHLTSSSSPLVVPPLGQRRDALNYGSAQWALPIHPSRDCKYKFNRKWNELD